MRGYPPLMHHKATRTPSIPQVTNSIRHNTYTYFSSNINNAGNNQQVLPPSTSSATRGLLNFPEFNDAEMAGYGLRYSVWIIFVSATGFVAAAKFYFDHQQGAGLEVLVFCGPLVTLLMSGCFYSIICRRTQNNQHQETQAEPIATVTVANTTPNESIRQISMPVYISDS